ncbi:efflux RND transporter periplasmic adaptor subunit [Robertmurraya yapensis]|uniref:Efflux RND transporter periplasmic adaptor subunit n=1 Tax=Bacillus yapensis TaxID=2492960 RepID=A0A3S0IFW6_9BACI|nr:efflux RND transporter periplasmic adaptor subunit [Bacillus yapensis]RTR32951.1 efflux RND transporter periplasmic adaptor subunit [Bacillus yapensis]TKS96774.1 efflux RND transporter periplasmic adaptor subunit [Bacillus yapensis]
MNWKKWTVVTVIVLFVAVNFYLISKKDSEIARAAYIDEWRKIKEQNLILSKEKPGVVAPIEEEFVYFQNGAGDFEQFLVKEGDEVQIGTALFEYSPKNLEETIDQLEAEITRLESEEDALEDNIDNLEDIVLDLATSEDEESPSNEAMIASIDAEIYEKELQLSRIEAEIDKYEDLVSISDDGLSSLTVDSPIAGVVKSISHDLQNPVVTITSNDQQVVGLLDEDDMLEIKEGMSAVVYGSFGKMEGTIAKIGVNPEQEPQVGTKSEYQFVVEMGEEEVESGEVDSDEQSEVAEETPILSGTHVNLKITTLEVEDALTLPDETIHVGNIYVLKDDGTIEKRKAKTGIEINGIHEITSKAELDELVVYEPGNLKNKTAFFTPIDIAKMKKKDFKDMGKKEIFRYLGRGFLTR